jgi:putative glycosyltransferase (TIGR04372 family)
VFLRESEVIGWTKNRDWSYHNYRDSDISTYVAAAEALAEMGYTVFRMGALVKDPLVSKHPRVIDYATNGMRTEFLDIFLGAHCTFCISTGSGWDSVPTIFRRPILFVNMLPIFSPSASTLPIMLYPKLLMNQGSLTSLSLADLTQRNLATPLNTAAYADAGVEIRDLSSEELVEAVTEMAQRVEGIFVETPEQKEMQAKLKHILSTHPKLQPTPNYYPIRAEFASCFLSRYPNFLDGLD